VGRAVVTADTPAVREALVDRRHAWLCQPGEVESLAEGIAALKQDPDLRQSLAANGYRLFIERFSLNALTCELAAIVGELVRNRRANPVPR
jgi:glycosyltransferase involved in cell wall biosynthesis